MIPNATRGAAPHRRYERLIDRHFGGRSGPSAERELRAHLVGCARCRDYYDRHLLLATVDPAAAVPFQERLAQGLGLPAARRTGARLWWAALPAALGVTIAVLVGFPGHFSSVAEQPQARGARTSPGSQLLVYEVSDTGQARALSPRIAPDTALAFAYANVDHRRRLMVFAVDERGGVYWYYPAWTRAEEDPVAMTLKSDDAIHEIPERIRHRLGAGRLQIFGVFTDEDSSVKQIERIVAASPRDARGALLLSIPGARVVRRDVDVVSRP